MSSVTRLRSLPLLVLLALVVGSCDTMSGEEKVTIRKRVPASALAADCTAALSGSLQRADSTEGLVPAPMSGGELVCTEVTVTKVCLYDVETGENIDCQVTEVKCTDWVYVQDPPEGGGEDSDPPGDGGECCANPPCQDLCYQPPGGGSDPIPPPDTTTTTEYVDTPCEMPDPPDYCSQAGTCFDNNVSNATHEKMLEEMEAQGALNDLWQDSNFNLAEQYREEQGGFLVPFQDGYTFQRLQPGQITRQTACALEFQISPSSIPDGAIYVHTHPYTTGEQMDACLGPPIRYGNWVGDADRPALQQMGVDEGIIIDANEIIFYEASGSGPNGYADYDRCGY